MFSVLSPHFREEATHGPLHHSGLIRGGAQCACPCSKALGQEASDRYLHQQAGWAGSAGAMEVPSKAQMASSLVEILCQGVNQRPQEVLEESGFRDAEVACPMACRAVLACLKVMGAGVHHMPLAMRAPCTSGHAGSNATKPRSRTWKSLASGTL